MTLGPGVAARAALALLVWASACAPALAPLTLVDGGESTPDSSVVDGGGELDLATSPGGEVDAAGPGAADLATSPGGEMDAATGPPDSSAEQLCVDTINQYRASLGLPALKRWKTSEGCADGQAKSDAKTGRAHGAFTLCGELGQNECPGWPSPPTDALPQCLAQMWAEGPGADFNKHGHYLNMSNRSYTQVACGISELPDGTFWSVQDFR
jgi:hypothetical protein